MSTPSKVPAHEAVVKIIEEAMEKARRDATYYALEYLKRKEDMNEYNNPLGRELPKKVDDEMIKSAAEQRDGIWASRRVDGRSLDKTAMLLAFQAFDGKFRRGGITPAFIHPKRVVDRLRNEDESVRAAAWLHDVVEDTDVTMRDIKEQAFPIEVLTAVDLLTKKKGQPYEKYLSAVKAHPIARKVKIADMLDNISDDPTPEQIRKYAKGLLYLTEP